MSHRNAQSMTVGLLSPCGWGNLGDAAIFTSAIEQIRKRMPDAQIVAFTLNPLDTERRHGVPAYAIDAFAQGGFGMPSAGLKGARLLAEQLLNPIRAFSNRLHFALCRLLNLVTRPWRELTHWWGSYGHVRRCRLIVVCGGGQLDELWGGPWSHPYAMFKFAVLSRLTGARYVILSSGSATLKSRVGRWFVKHALRQANYRSFREQFAVQLARELGAPEPNAWFPDLAFSLSVPPRSPRRQLHRRTIGISPIAWCDPRSWPQKDSHRYEAYVRRMVELLGALIARSDDIILFATAAADHAVIADVVQRLRMQAIPNLDSRLQISEARTVPDLLDVLRSVEVVIASRLHGVLLSYVCRLPVAAISYDPKVAYLAESFEQQEACLSIDDFETRQLQTTLDRLYANREVVSMQLELKIAACKARLAEQYDLVFGPATPEGHGEFVEATKNFGARRAEQTVDNSRLTLD